MNNIIGNNGEEKFANGQSSRDLRVSSNGAELETQLDVGPLRKRTDSSDRLKALRKKSAEDFHSPKSLRRASRNAVLDVPEAADPEEGYAA